MSQPKTTCKNCEQTFKASFNFCPHCGQKAKDELTLGVLFYNTISNYFTFDARFFKSFLPLMFKPGYIASKFIEGKRLFYLHPAQLYLFISVVFFFLYSFQVNKQERALETAMSAEKNIQEATRSISSAKEKDSVASAMYLKNIMEHQDVLGINDEELLKIDSLVKNQGYKGGNNVSFDFNEQKVDSLITINAADELIFKEMGMASDAGKWKRKLYTQILKLYKDNGGLANVLRRFYDTIPIAMFVLLPLFAFILKLLFFKRGRFAHHLVFSFYFFSFLFTVFSVLLLIAYIWDVLPGWLQFLIILSTFIYLLLAIKRFYGQSWKMSILKTSVASFSFLLLVLPLTAVIVLAFAFMSY